MNYVLIDRGNGTPVIKNQNKLQLAATRDPNALRVFQDSVKAVLETLTPNKIAIKSKPERGAHQAGSASLKMEAILLANSKCEIEFISGHKINKTTLEEQPKHKYLWSATAAAIAANT
jgi:hypothetical protein